MDVSQDTFARKKPDQLVYLELGSGNGGMLISVSEDGFRFRAVSPLRADSGVPFAFSLDGKHRLQGVGEVEWLEGDGKSGGMRFTDLSAESRAAIDEWLATDSRSHLGREAAPAAETPLDTMEKIREELRSGYPARPAGQNREAAKGQRETPVVKEKSAAPEPPKPKSNNNNVANKVAPPARKPIEPPAKPASVPPPSPPSTVFTNSAFLKIPREAPAETPTGQTASGPAASSAAPPAFVRPPFSTPADEPPGPATTAAVPHVLTPPEDVAPSRPAPGHTSVRPPFTKHIQETGKAPVSIPSAPAAALEAPAPLPSLRTFTVNDTGDVSSATIPERPYIPPPEETYEQAWASAKLTSPPESPHLSRAAAGSIIGIALLLIAGALALNFRQDIGTMFVDLGHKISGENRAAAAAPDSSPQSPGDSGTTGEDQPADSDNLPAKNEDAAAANSHVSPSTPTGSAATNAGAQPKSDSKPVEEPAGKTPSKRGTAKSDTTGPANSPPPTTAQRDTKPATSSAHAVKPVEEPPATEPSEPGAGQEEFNLARDFLKGGNKQQDLPKAVALLWSGVRKGYVPAEVTLADLYRRGEGVEKNCDQARVLLVAASKKGSPDARRILEYMAENGCE